MQIARRILCCILTLFILSTSLGQDKAEAGVVKDAADLTATVAKGVVNGAVGATKIIVKGVVAVAKAVARGAAGTAKAVARGAAGTAKAAAKGAAGTSTAVAKGAGGSAKAFAKEAGDGARFIAKGSEKAVGAVGKGAEITKNAGRGNGESFEKFNLSKDAARSTGEPSVSNGVPTERKSFGGEATRSQVKELLEGGGGVQRYSRLPADSRGTWTGERGNSGFIPRDKSITQGKPIPFVNNKPVFSEFAKDKISVSGMDGSGRDLRVAKSIIPDFPDDRAIS